MRRSARRQVAVCGQARRENAMKLTKGIGMLTALSVVLAGGLIVWAQDKGDKKMEEGERKVKEAEVPKAALDALKKLAGGAAFTEFAEEIEHGHKYYEGSWKGPDGNVDGLVTETGDVVEIEETIQSEKAPASVREAAEKEAGKDAKPTYEKKTVYLYEIHYKKDGKTRESIFTADGRVFHEEGEKAGEKKNGKDDDDD